MYLSEFEIKQAAVTNMFAIRNNVTGMFSFVCNACGERRERFADNASSAAMHFAGSGVVAEGKHIWCSKCAHLKLPTANDKPLPPTL